MDIKASTSQRQVETALAQQSKVHKFRSSTQEDVRNMSQFYRIGARRELYNSNITHSSKLQG